jgi:hypothetical protein
MGDVGGVGDGWVDQIVVVFPGKPGYWYENPRNKPGHWNTYVIRCQGPHIQLWLNGVKTVDYTAADDKIDRTGIIALQIHGGGPSEAWYKDITITELE